MGTPAGWGAERLWCWDRDHLEQPYKSEEAEEDLWGPGREQLPRHRKGAGSSPAQRAGPRHVARRSSYSLEATSDLSFQAGIHRPQATPLPGVEGAGSAHLLQSLGLLLKCPSAAPAPPPRLPSLSAGASLPMAGGAHQDHPGKSSNHFCKVPWPRERTFVGSTIRTS